MSDNLAVKVRYGLGSESVNVASTWDEGGRSYSRMDTPIGNLLSDG
ncbi:hypothetical protein [Fervidobacterium sp.]